MAAPLFAVAWRSEQLFNQLLVGVGTRIGGKGLDLGAGRRQSMQVIRGSPNQGEFVGGGGEFQAFFRELGVDEVVNVVSRRPDGRLKGPPRRSFGGGRAARGEDGPGGKPSGKQGRIGGGQLAGGRHFDFAGVGDSGQHAVPVGGEVSGRRQPDPSHLHLLVVTLLALPS